MNSQEIRSVMVLAGIFALRMLGLCMLLPVFALEALHYEQANSQTIGVAIGVYGLLQALLQVPFGMLSDRFGRKPLIIIGLSFIVLGSLISARASSIYGLILGRAFQGCGAIGSVVIATLADSTREQVRSSAMAILGASIGAAFVLAMVLGPWLNQRFGLTSIFTVTGTLAIVCIACIPVLPKFRSTLSTKAPILSANRQLWGLNLGAFVLHAGLAALFLVLPLLLQEAGVSPLQVWQVYLGALIISMAISWTLLRYAERNGGVANLLQVGIIALLCGPGLINATNSIFGMLIGIVLYFSAFCFLEASLPTLVTKYADSKKRGAYMGMYATLQFMGVFFGGIIGGWLHGKFGVMAVIGFSIGLAALWLILSIILKVKNEVRIWQEA